MPWTFAHPAAVLALRPLWRGREGLLAALAGSVAPDLGYHFGRFDLAAKAHTWPGLLWLAVPSAWLLWWLACRWYGRVAALLPQPHRFAWCGLADSVHPPGWRRGGGIVAMLLAGVLTHVAWDGFTHPDGWAVLRLGGLSAPAFFIGGQAIPWFKGLQHLSTLAGLCLLVLAYRRWIRRRSPGSPDEAPASRRARLLALAVLGVGSLATATCLVLGAAWAAQDPSAAARVLVRIVIHSSTIFFLGLVALAWWRAGQGRAD